MRAAALLAAALCVVPCLSLIAQQPAAADRKSAADQVSATGSARSRITVTATARSYRIGDSSVTERVATARYELFFDRFRFRVDGSALRFATRADTITGSLPVAARLDVALRPGDTLTAFVRSASNPFDLSTRQTAALGSAGTSTVDLESSALGTPAVGGGRAAFAFPVGDMVLAARGGVEVEPRPDGAQPVYWRGTTLRGGVALTTSAGDGSFTASLDATRSSADSLAGRNLFPGGGSMTLQLLADVSVPNPFDPLEDERWPIRALGFFARPFGNERSDQPNLIIPQGNLLGTVATMLVPAGDLTFAPTLQLLRETSVSESVSGLISGAHDALREELQTSLSARGANPFPRTASYWTGLLRSSGRRAARVGELSSVMILSTAGQQHAWMMQWRSAAVELERMRLHELGAVDLARVAADLEDSCVVSALTARDSQGSGLIEQQHWLHRRRRA